MRSDWLAASSLERTHEVISAITILSIHAKLLLVNVDDPTDSAAIAMARMRLLSFLAELEPLLKEVTDDPDETVVGVDPRLGELAIQYFTQRQRGPRRRPSLYDVPFENLRSLIGSENREDLPRLVDYLRDLRLLLERHSHVDVVSILGEV